MSEIAAAFDVPKDIKRTLRSGLSIIAQLDEQKQRELLEWARVPRATGFYGDNNSLVSETGVEHRDAGQVRMAVVMMVGSLASSATTSDEFLEAGLTNEAFSNSEIAGIKRFAELIIDSRTELIEENDIAKLQNAVLPTLLEFDFSLDARIQIFEGSVKYAVPVVIAYLDTDSEDQVLWFQMNEERVTELRDKLTAMLDQIDVLKVWLSKSSKLES